MKISNHLIYPSKYLKSNHLNKNINMKFKQLLILSVSLFIQNKFKQLNLLPFFNHIPKPRNGKHQKLNAAKCHPVRH